MQSCTGELKTLPVTRRQVLGAEQQHAEKGLRVIIALCIYAGMQQARRLQRRHLPCAALCRGCCSRGALPCCARALSLRWGLLRPFLGARTLRPFWRPCPPPWLLPRLNSPCVVICRIRVSVFV